MSSFQLLEPREEDELHKSRLLNVEEKPFKRLTKRLIVPGSLLSTPSKLPTPPPDAVDAQAALEAESQKILDERRQFREDVLLDFAAFDSSIARIQFLQNSNQRERERYEADKQRILDTAQAVRDNTVQLRIQLEEAQKVMAQRKKFDALADKITNNKLLRPREDQEVNLRKLEEECKELERESETYAETWQERRQQFNKIVEEGLQLRRLIRDEKEEVERREAMDINEDDGEVAEGQTPKYSSMSGNATPRPDATRQGSPDIGGLKPRLNPSGRTTRSVSKAPSNAGSQAGSRAPSRANSRAGSPAPSEKASQQEDAMAVEDEKKVADEALEVDVVMGEGNDQDSVKVEEEDAIPPADTSAQEKPTEEKEDKMDTT